MTTVEAATHRHTRTIRVLLAVAVVWSTAVIVGALTLPVYGDRSLVEENGNGVLVVMALPLVASLVVAVALSFRGIVARVVAWGATGAVGLIAVLGMLTVGPAILPVAGCLAAACAFDLS